MGDRCQFDYLEVIDARDDPEGMVFPEVDSIKAMTVDTLLATREERVKALGFSVQPVHDIRLDEEAEEHWKNEDEQRRDGFENEMRSHDDD